MEPITQRALTAVPLINEQRLPAIYVNPVTLGSRKIWASRACSNSPNLNCIVRHPGQPPLQDHTRLPAIKSIKSASGIMNGLEPIGFEFYMFITYLIEFVALSDNEKDNQT